MTDLEIITLRDAGARLAELQRSKEDVACGKLLALLCAGKINAGFQFPVCDSTVWVSIPQYYWTKISVADFKVIRYSKGNRSSGAFRVRLRQFAKEVVTEVSAAGVRQGLPSVEVLNALLAATANAYDVVIKAADWTEYETLNRPPVSEQPNKSTSGRHQKEGWRDTATLIGVYVANHYKSTQEPFKLVEASKEIANLGVEKKIADLPRSGSIQRVLSNILAELKGSSGE